MKRYDGLTPEGCLLGFCAPWRRMRTLARTYAHSCGCAAAFGGGCGGDCANHIRRRSRGVQEPAAPKGALHAAYAEGHDEGLVKLQVIHKNGTLFNLDMRQFIR